MLKFSNEFFEISPDLEHDEADDEFYLVKIRDVKIDINKFRDFFPQNQILHMMDSVLRNEVALQVTTILKNTFKKYGMLDSYLDENIRLINVDLKNNMPLHLTILSHFPDRLQNYKITDLYIEFLMEDIDLVTFKYEYTLEYLRIKNEVFWLSYYQLNQ